MRVKLIGVSDTTRKSESVARSREHRRRLIGTALLHIGETVHRHCGRHIKCGLAAASSVNSFEEPDDFERTSRRDLCSSGISSVFVMRERLP